MILFHPHTWLLISRESGKHAIRVARVVVVARIDVAVRVDIGEVVGISRWRAAEPNVGSQTKV